MVKSPDFSVEGGKYAIDSTREFDKAFRKAVKQGYDVRKLGLVVNKLARGEKLEDRYRDHKLSGNYDGYRECHLEPDWLLMYRYVDDRLVLVLAKLGTHSQLFGR